jgi:chromosome partitioning protein
VLIALVSEKGGVGKSTLALAIAWELRARGTTVLVVDADPQQTLMAAARMATDAGLNPPTTVSMDSNLWQKDQLPQLAKGFQHVVLDTPGRADKVQRSALSVADVALIPVGQYGPDIWALKAAVDVLGEAQALRHELLGAVVLTKKRPRTVLGKDLREATESAGIPILKTEVTDRVAWGESITAGQGVAQYNPKDAAAAEAKALVTEILAMVKKPKGKGRVKK